MIEVVGRDLQQTKRVTRKEARVGGNIIICRGKGLDYQTGVRGIGLESDPHICD